VYSVPRPPKSTLALTGLLPLGTQVALAVLIILAGVLLLRWTVVRRGRARD